MNKGATGLRDHDWHPFDELAGWEVRRAGGVWQARHIDRPDQIRTLSEDEFAQWREAGPNPTGLT